LERRIERKSAANKNYTTSYATIDDMIDELAEIRKEMSKIRNCTIVASHSSSKCLKDTQEYLGVNTLGSDSDRKAGKASKGRDEAATRPPNFAVTGKPPVTTVQKKSV